MDITEMKVGDRAEITGYTETEAGYRAKLLALGLGSNKNYSTKSKK